MIIANLLITPDGTVLQSKHNHDYVTYKDKNGKWYMIDGGPLSLRSSANGDEIFKIIEDTSPHEEIRQYFLWGTYGKKGDKPLKFVPLHKLSALHIKNIIKTQTHLTQNYIKIFVDELVYRKSK